MSSVLAEEGRCAKVMVVAEASGGHIFPALAFIESLREELKKTDFILVLPQRSRNNNIIIEGLQIKYSSVSPLRLRIGLKNLFAVFGLFKGCLQSMFWIFKFKPDIAVGFGGLNSFVFILSARILGVKSLIHEQNVIPGKANKFLAGFCDRIAISFPETGDFFKVNPEKLVFTGNPLRKRLQIIDKEKALGYFGFKPGNLTFLVMGGSQGSYRINHSFLEAVTMLLDFKRINVIHLCGSQDLEFLKESYRALGIESRVYAFFEEMEYAYSASDLALCRSGAITVSELIRFKLPSVLVPYPYAQRHQSANASVLKNKECALVIEEDDLSSGQLSRRLAEFIDNPSLLKNMRAGFDSFLPNIADKKLAKAASDLLVKR